MIYIILAIIVILAITGVVLYFTVFKKENSGKNWSFIKNENFKIQKDVYGHEYIECNILINSNDGKYKYIGLIDLIKKEMTQEKYDRIPPTLYNTSVEKVSDDYVSEHNHELKILPANFKYRITYIPDKGYKIDNIAESHITDPTNYYESKLLKKPSNKLRDISQYLIDSNMFKDDNKVEGLKELIKEKPQLFWNFETKDNKLCIKTKDKNKSLFVVKDDRDPIEFVGLSTYNTKYNIKLQKPFPTVKKELRELMSP